MKTVNVAELKNKLSAYLDEVEKGEEVIVKNRRKVVARIVSVDASKMDEEWALVAEGKLRMPGIKLTKQFLERFLAARMPPVSTGSSVQAVVNDRDER